MRAELVRRMTKRTTTLRRLVAPWTLILIATGLFQLFRGAPVDAAFFLCIAALLVADAAGLVRVAGTGQPRLAVLLGAAAVLGTLLVLAPRHGAVEGLIAAGIGVSVLLFAWPSHDGHTDVPGVTTEALRRAAILWAAIGVACCLWEVASFLLGLASPEAAAEHPSISLLLDPVVDTTLGRIVFIALWLLGGIALLRRGRGR
ncbi:MAG: hypothetical protein JWO18_2298 [Microbacteriaceae bacterium]|jgi:hypothetical protein|nr:hypothetical protein [Microbacteriaceae bacterium]